MDFFQHQDVARKSSRILVAYFLLAVVATVLGVYAAASFLLFWLHSSASLDFRFWDLDRFLLVAGGALLVIGAGTAYKIWRLSEGGESVARLLGGRPLDPNTREPKERRVLNVVEEMAIASGIPVPTVYLLDAEKSINAFAAGFAPQDAVLGVTRGTLDLLSRDELQGVIAHEFSHIVNGDMRLNLRLMGVLHGILVIALLGYFILRSSLRAASRDRKGALGFLPLLGLALVVVGYVGVFFGRLIKSGVSRQRELLADASAVQFTRNPLGIGGALKKIGGLAEGSLIMSPHAEQASHFFFSDGKLGKVRSALSGVTHFELLATHPPLRERIRRIDPGWDGVYPEVEPIEPLEVVPEAEPTLKKPRLFRLLPLQLAALVGTLDEDHLAHARRLLAGIPESVRDAVREPAGARAVVLALLLHRDAAVREKQLGWLASADDAALRRDTEAIAAHLANSPRELRLPLLDLATPALRRVSRPQYEALMQLVKRFVEADRQIDLFEYTLGHILERHLAPAFERTRPPSVQYYALVTLRKECSVLLSAIAHAGQKDASRARQAFAIGARELDGLELDFHPRAESGLVGVRDALTKLASVAPNLKKDVARAMIAAAAHDGRMTVGEGELLRALADALGLPMPPFLPGQTLASSPASALA